MSLATRLTTSLASENDRWAEGIIKLEADLGVIVGDVLLASGFVSYVGPFSKAFRDKIMGDKFIKFLKTEKIPFTETLDVCMLLANEASIATWNNQKLPADRVSTENGCILTNSERWPLMIDPQLQGITWIKNKEQSNDLQVTRMTNDKKVRIMEGAIERGQTILIENLGETIDAVFAPVISRSVIKRGRQK